MCNAISGFIDPDTHKIVCAHPASHHKTQVILGLKMDVRERLCEWEWEVGGDLMVRHTDPAVIRDMRKSILAAHAERDSLLAEVRPMFERHGNYLVESAEDWGRVPREVPGELVITIKGAVRCEWLVKSGDIYAPSATSLDLLLLVKSGNICAPRATSLDLLLLAKSGHIYAPSATSLDLHRKNPNYARLSAQIASQK